MSSNKTPNYNLHSWLPADEFHVSEVNENFAALDTAVGGQLAALSQALDTQVRMVTGRYTGKTGDSADPQTATHVSLGVKAKAVIIVNVQRYISGTDMSFLLVENGTAHTAAALTEDGFTVMNAGANGALLNYSGTVYHYAAFF